MESKALGLIEVKGLLGAIEVADVALKTADVKLLNKEVIKGGLTTIQVIGDVGAVKSAVEAGEESAKRLGCYLSSHVIPRVDNETFKILTKQKVDVEVKEEKISEELEQNVLNDDSLIDYENIKLSELKKIAYQLEIPEVPKDEIKKGNREELIEIIKKFKDKEV